MTTQVTPSLKEFVELAKRGNVIPIFAEFVGDCETPVSAFKKSSCRPYSFLFESTEKNDVSGRFSFVGFDPRIIIKSYRREIQIVRNGVEERFGTATDPLDEFRKLMARYQFVARPELPRFAGGAVGFLGYEAIGFFEPKVRTAREDDLQLFFQAEDGIRDLTVTGVQTCALPISEVPLTLTRLNRPAARRRSAGAGGRRACARSPPSAARRRAAGGAPRAPRRPGLSRWGSEERRVGEEGRTRWSADHYKKKENDAC